MPAVQCFESDSTWDPKGGFFFLWKKKRRRGELTRYILSAWMSENADGFLFLERKNFSLFSVRQWILFFCFFVFSFHTLLGFSAAVHDPVQSWPLYMFVYDADSGRSWVHQYQRNYRLGTFFPPHYSQCGRRDIYVWKRKKNAACFLCVLCHILVFAVLSSVYSVVVRFFGVLAMW